DYYRLLKTQPATNPNPKSKKQPKTQRKKFPRRKPAVRSYFQRVLLSSPEIFRDILRWFEMIVAPKSSLNQEKTA
ncbi:MAG: hypothetical protein ACLQO7_00390, partial [Candidatus Bathyarchaeia archaeon]